MNEFFVLLLRFNEGFVVSNKGYFGSPYNAMLQWCQGAAIKRTKNRIYWLAAAWSIPFCTCLFIRSDHSLTTYHIIASDGAIQKDDDVVVIMRELMIAARFTNRVTNCKKDWAHGGCDASMWDHV